MTPKKGLNVPLITVLDAAGHIIEADQRRVVRHTIQDGHGADSVFLCGTTGEFNRMTNRQRQQLFKIGVDETRRVNAELPDGTPEIEAWVGVTAPTKRETLENMRYAREIKADLAVVSPLTIADLPPAEIVGFFTNEIAEIVGDDLPISLYDNPDIAAAPDVMANMPVELIERLRRLPFVVCLKASVTRAVLQSFLNAFSGANGKPQFDVYYGNAPLIFVLDEMQSEAAMNEHRVAGVVSGTANLFPREWQKAWRAVVDGDAESVSFYRDAFADFEKLCFSENGRYATTKLIAGIKQGLYFQGVIGNPSVGAGTAAMTAEEAEKLNGGLAKVLEKLGRIGGAQTLSKDA